MALAAAVTAGVGLTLLSITPPKPVARRMMLAVSDRALFPPADTERATYALHKLVGMYLEYTIAGKMARTAAARRDLHGDVARIAFVLDRAQQRMISAKDLPHDAQDWPVLVAGVGYCDQVNAAICRILAHSFPHAQLFALNDPVTGTSPHTIGRVWSNERNEWLYFDGFGRRVVFRKTAAGEVEILSDGAASAADVLRLYRLGGWVMNEYPSTYPMYVASSIKRRWRPEPTPPLVVPPPLPPALPDATATTPAAAPAPPPLPDSDAASRSIAKTYVRARADDLFGDAQEAQKEYRAVATAAASLNPRVAILQAAARRFGEHD